MIQTTTDYTMTVNEMAAFRALLKMQSDIGPGMPSPGQTQLWDFFGILNDVAYTHYRLTNNAQLKSWMDSLFNVVIATNTSYTIDGKSLTTAGMYLLYMYYQFNVPFMTQANKLEPNRVYSNGFPIGARDENTGTWLPQSGEGLANEVPWIWFGPTPYSIFFAPTTVPSFYDALTTNGHLLDHGIALQKGSTATVALEYSGDSMISEHTLDEVQQFQYSRFDPANWTDSNTFVQAVQKTTIWQEQSGTVTNLLHEATITADAYFYLLHLLIALGTSNTNDQQLAHKIVSAPVNSMEYPNDTFSNQIVYLILMYFIDPLGDYGYNNQQLQGLLNDLIGVVVGTDPASQAIKQSLNNQLKILHSDSSYPLQDPYYPSFGFTTRQSDTLSALDIARSALT